MNNKEYLSKDNVEFVWDLSLIQKGILTKLEENRYNAGNHPAVNVVCSVDGKLDVGKVKEAWALTVGQTNLLRTVFRKARNRTVQVVLKQYPAPLEVIDAVGENGDFRRLIRDQMIRSNDLNLLEGPTATLKVFLQGEEKTTFLLNCHQALCDRSSLLRVMEDFWGLYRGITNGGNPVATARPSFKLYLDWLFQQYWAPVYGFWQKELEGFEAPSSLLKYHRFKEDVYPPAIEMMMLPAAVAEGLEALATDAGVAPAIIVHAAWGLLLELYTREKNVAFGAEFDQYSYFKEEFGDLVGPLSNTLPVALEIDPDTSLVDYLKSVAEKIAELQKYSYVPIEEIRTNVPQVNGLELFESVVSVHERTETFEFGQFQFWQGGENRFQLHATIGGQWEIRLLSRGGVPERFLSQALEHYRGLLVELAGRRDVSLGRLRRVPEDQEWSAVQSCPDSGFPPPDKFMHELLAEFAAASPDETACFLDDRQLTYRALNENANRLAHWLIERGLGRDDRAVIFCHRSIEMLTAILAVFKAGGAYIPLDPKDPDSRLFGVLGDSRAKILLTARQHFGRVQDMASTLEYPPGIFCFDGGSWEHGGLPDAGLLKDFSPTNPCRPLELRDLAYIIYTSGSTGVPKGAMVEHAGMLNHLWTKIHLLRLDRSCRVVQNASHCFDISVWQFLSALMVGGQTVIFNNDTAMDPDALIRCARKHRVTILEMVPAVIDMVLAGQSGDHPAWDVPDIRFMLSTGEALPVALCKRWLERYPEIPVVNAYGPTECSDDTHHKVITSVDDLFGQKGNVALGSVIPNFNCFIVDSQNRLLPKGCAGEICLAGAGVGRGYLNDPAKTQLVFIKNELSGSPYRPVYRTGDLGYFDPGGDLVFLGRIDFQVKIRGHRIELGEIASRLEKHGAVKHCVAISRKDSQGQDMIVAYVVTGKEVSAVELREYLLESLPEYMVPAHIVEMDRLPLNRNGKLDLKALPDPGEDQLEVSGYNAPSTPLEKELVEIWGEILEISPIGIDSNFFELGGHSLKVIQMRSRINQKFDIDLTVTDLFKKQTIRELAAFIEASAGAGERIEGGGIPRQAEAPFYPMSHSQQRLFFIQQLEPMNRSYNMPTAMEFTDLLDVLAVERALKIIVERHQTLRTYFGIHEGMPVQMVSPEPKVAFAFVDLSGLDDQDRTNALDDWARKQAEHVFDLENGPLFYSAALKLQEKRFLLFFNMHHIVGDFWSWEIFFTEFFAYYKAFAAGVELERNELPIQYSDYSAWQKIRIAEGGFKTHEEFWRGYLGGELSQLELPLDFPRPKLQTFAGEVIQRSVPSQIVTLGRDCFAQAGVTQFLGYMAVFIAFLNRLTGQRDIVAGTVEAGRNRVELEEVIGFFVNTIPMRLRWNGDPSFRELLGHARQAGMEVFEHAEYPFDLILEPLDLPRDLSRHPLIGAMFQLNQENSPGELFDLPLRLYSMPAQFINFDLHVALVEHSEGMNCIFSYNKSLFKKDTIERWIDHFIVFSEGVLTSPEEPVATVRLLSEEQLRVLLHDWNGTGREFPDVENIYELFEEQVKRTQDSVALTFKDLAMTYDHLHRQSVRLAHTLRELGNGSDVPVGLFLERGVEVVVALLGTMRSGAYYIPFDPTFPADRLRFMVEDSGVRTVIVSTGLETGRPLGDLQYLEIGREFLANTHPQNPWPANIKTGERAYLIYTSGSTGTPKGVEISHRSLANFSSCMKRIFGLSGDIFLAVTSLSFDIAFLECFVPLTAGGKVVIAADDEVRDGGAMAGAIARECATIMQATPATWKLLLHSGWRGSDYLACLTGGEAVPVEMARQLSSGNRELWNMYGPTEATIWCSIHKFPTDFQSVSIGKPLDNTGMYILNPSLKPVPIGVAGELYIGGACLALGYWNDASLTADKFIADPFSSAPEDRLYRTGDLARYRDDGTIEFIGRTDHQVKVRGYRIELGEIEAKLSCHRNIEEVVALVEDDGGGEKHIAAYILFRPGADGASRPGSIDLRAFLTGRLPRYMIPGRFLEIDRVPLTPNGKVDRKALPSVGRPLAGDGDRLPFSPANETEQLALEAWRQVLGVTEIGMDDSFFDLGGHSLKAMQLVAHLAKMGIAATVNDLFRHQTIKEFAGFAGRMTGGESKALRTFHDVEQEFGALFGVECGFVSIHVENRRFTVFCIQGLIRLDRESVMDFFREKVDIDVSPHFLRDWSEMPGVGTAELWLGRDEFCSLMKIHSLPDSLMAEVSGLVENGWNVMNGIIVSGKIVARYPPSPVQRYHLTIGDRFTNSILLLDRILDVRILEAALMELINRQGLLRCSLAEEHGDRLWREFAKVASVPIPVVDLEGFDPMEHDGFIRKTIRQLGHPYKIDGHSIFYRVVLFRMNLREHALVLSFDHSIFDGMSGDIIRRRLYEFYMSKERKQPVDAPIPKPYSDYVAQVGAGPQGIDAESLINEFRLNDFHRSKEEFQELMERRSNANQSSASFLISFDRDLSGERIWELTFLLFSMALGRYFDSRRIPLSLVSYGRNYQGGGYYDTVGEFIDLVPMVTDLDNEAVADVFLQVRRRLELARAHNINFLGLSLDPRLKLEWAQVASLYSSRRLDAAEFLAVFNFVGETPAGISLDWYRPVSERIDPGGRRILCEVYHNERSIVFTLGGYPEIEIPQLHRLLDEELLKILKKFSGSHSGASYGIELLTRGDDQ